MPDGTTTVLGLTLPEEFASDDTWGGKLNANFTSLDLFFQLNGSDKVLKVANGGTGAASASAARTSLGAAASGAIGSTGITMTTARLVGRTTASTGAPEEISVGTGLTLTGLTLAALAASETVVGSMEIATSAEVLTGTDNTRAVTPAGLTSKEATASEFRNNTADKILTTNEVWSAADGVALTDGATITPDFSAGLNFTVTLGGNRTLANPTNTKVGQSGFIRINQDGTGSRTLAFGTDWKFAGGVDGVLTTTASATDVLYYTVIAANFIHASLVKGLA